MHRTRSKSHVVEKVDFVGWRVGVHETLEEEVASLRQELGMLGPAYLEPRLRTVWKWIMDAGDTYYYPTGDEQLTPSL